MVNWAKGYSASYYAEKVDPATWRDVELIKLTGGTIKRETTGKRQSADLGCVNYHIGVEQWVRVYFDVRQDGSSAHVPLFTGLATSPSDDINGNLTTNTLTCYSVLKPAEDVILSRGWYAPAGMSGGELIRRLLSVGPAPVSVADNSPVLYESIIAEDGETNLSMVDRILDAMGWRMRIDGDGTVNILPAGIEPVAQFDPLENDLIETHIIVSADWYSCPNVYMAVSGDLTGIARDDNPDSILSTISRGREVWRYESGCSLSASESIAEYALRKLAEAQRTQQTASYDRRYVPDVMPGDIVKMHYSRQGLTGNYNVESQSIALGYGAKTSEEISAYISVSDLTETASDVVLANIISDSGAYLIDSDGNHIVGLVEV